ncbi:MAG: hypothetical protein FWH38_05115, partial [Treponema sp.]|nr:hypothetical protein [Treponema sp.]
QELDSLENELNRLEKRTEGVESWLSVLKRRRQLAAYGPPYEQGFRQSSARAAQVFPYSETIAAVAAAALIRDAAITREAEERLRKYLPLLGDSRFAAMRLGFHVLLGDFRDPLKAAENLSAGFEGPELWVPDFPLPVPARDAEMIAADFIILKILSGDMRGAGADIHAALLAFPSPEIIRLAAEYFYDFGDMLRSAELFSMLPDEQALSRQADALWLAGYAANARNIWSLLASPAGAPQSGDARQNWPALRDKALYNLALTAAATGEAAALLERLKGQGVREDAVRGFGIIRYSRLLDPQMAISVLEEEKSSVGPGPESGGLPDALISLEMVKRRAEIDEPARAVAETWLLLEQYPETEELYRWGAWFMNFRRNFGECALLLKTAARHGFSGPWAAVHEALLQVRDGMLDAAEKTLETAAPESAGWAAAANLGRILETRHAPAQALEQYQIASAALLEANYEPPSAILDESRQIRQKAASRVHVRAAYCYKAMGRPSESRQELEYALLLNPDNLDARLELSRLE